MPIIFDFITWYTLCLFKLVTYLSYETTYHRKTTLPNLLGTKLYEGKWILSFYTFFRTHHLLYYVINMIRLSQHEFLILSWAMEPIGRLVTHF